LPLGSAQYALTNGLDDLIVGAFFAEPNGKLSAGESYVVFGKGNSRAINLSAIADASNPTGGIVINGETRYDRSGYSVSSAGDVNGDVEFQSVIT
jgi:hypothetical protein